MGKRFAGAGLRGRIRDGLIGSIEELKAEFKTEAKRTHPDLAGGDAADEFVRLRRDYEAALHELTASGEIYGDPFVALGLLLKRNFPKKPRHRKERLRYTYARIRAREAVMTLGDGAGRLFDEAEKELLALKERDERDFRAALRLFTDIVAARRDGTPALIAAVRMELGRRSAAALGAGTAHDAEDKRLGAAAAAFLRLLAEG